MTRRSFLRWLAAAPAAAPMVLPALSQGGLALVQGAVSWPGRVARAARLRRWSGILMRQHHSVWWSAFSGERGSGSVIQITRSRRLSAPWAP